MDEQQVAKALFIWEKSRSPLNRKPVEELAKDWDDVPLQEKTRLTERARGFLVVCQDISKGRI